MTLNLISLKVIQEYISLRFNNITTSNPTLSSQFETVVLKSNIDNFLKKNEDNKCFLIFYLLMPTQSNILIEYFNKNQNYKNDQQSYVN